MINPQLAAPTAINEAISALDYESLVPLPTDGLTAEALELLMTAREMLTDKAWPELPARSLDAEAFEAWHSAKSAEQRQDGRQ